MKAQSHDTRLGAVSTLTFAVIAAFSAFAAGQESVPDAFQDVSKIVAFAKRADAVGVPVKMLAEVVHVSALRENTCAVASTEKPWEEGVVVKVPDSRAFAPGDVLLVEGTTVADGRALGVRADRT